MNARNSASVYDEYKDRLRSAALLANASTVLDVDSMFSLSEKSGGIRSEQLGVIQTMIHRLTTDAEYAAMLESLRTADLDEARRANVRVSLREFMKSKRIPERLVKELAEAQSLGKEAYYEARGKKDFSIFAPKLERLVELKREYAACVGSETPYDALLDDYETGLTQAKLDPVFAAVRARLVPAVRAIYADPEGVEPFRVTWSSKTKDMSLYRELLEEMGFDLSRGSVQEAPAGFMIDGNPNDARIYFRDKDNGLLGTIATIMHEGGHGLYEQNLSEADLGLPVGKYASYMVHESQSRLYENHVGLSRAFCRRLHMKLARLYHEEMAGTGPEEFYRRANAVAPSKRRTESDELSYHVHILIRYELERDLVNGKISVAELPASWNGKYREYLGIEFDNDAEGVMQDVHWSDGSFGYFPTYSLWTFHSAQYFAKMREIFPDMDRMLAEGDLLPIRDWLNRNVHSKGRLLTGEELLVAATGRPLDMDSYFDYAEGKYREIYPKAF